MKNIITKIQKPEIYEPGSAFMWTNEHISKQLLNVHLNPKLDLASRKMSSINKTANFILESKKTTEKLNILDLGCGPGLYSEIFAKKGHNITSVDISKTSIEYAKNSASRNDYEIEYKNANYIELELEENIFDIVILIYTDFGVLTPDERKILLNKVYRSLKKGGLFIFDVLKNNNIEEKISPKTWEASMCGFWKDSPHIALSESFLYEKENLILYQHTVIGEKNDVKVYRFWTHFFSQNNIFQMLKEHNFLNINFREDILPEDDLWNGDNVIFCIAEK